jgi:hypothetical protein
MNDKKLHKTKFRLFQIGMFFAITFGSVLFFAPTIHAQNDNSDQGATMMDITYNPKFMLGLGGSAETDLDINGPLPTVHSDDDMEPSLGAGFEVDFPLHKYFLLGGMFSFHSWITDVLDDATGDRNYMFDFSLVPKARFPFEKTPVAIYLALPIGFSLDSYDEDNAPVDVDVGYGMNLSVLVGAQVNLTSYFGLMLELGYSYHYFSHDISNPGGEAEGDLHQFQLNVGVYFM